MIDPHATPLDEVLTANGLPPRRDQPTVSERMEHLAATGKSFATPAAPAPQGLQGPLRSLAELEQRAIAFIDAVETRGLTITVLGLPITIQIPKP